MTFDWGGYSFEGAFDNPSGLEARSGVYLVFCKVGEDWKVLDVGESGDVRARILSHDRKDCWSRNCRGTMYFAAHYTTGLSEEERRTIEVNLRAKYRPPCGF